MDEHRVGGLTVAHTCDPFAATSGAVIPGQQAATPGQEVHHPLALRARESRELHRDIHDQPDGNRRTRYLGSGFRVILRRMRVSCVWNSPAARGKFPARGDTGARRRPKDGLDFTS